MSQLVSQCLFSSSLHGGLVFVLCTWKKFSHFMFCCVYYYFFNYLVLYKGIYLVCGGMHDTVFVLCVCGSSLCIFMFCCLYYFLDYLILYEGMYNVHGGTHDIELLEGRGHFRQYILVAGLSGLSSTVSGLSSIVSCLLSVTYCQFIVSSDHQIFNSSLFFTFLQLTPLLPCLHW